MTFNTFLKNSGILAGDHLLIHSSLKKIRQVFPDITAGEIIKSLVNHVTPVGSIVMPVFTYCFKKLDNSHEIFDQLNSKSKTGYLTEFFRQYPGVERTASPTHSFSYIGDISKHIAPENNPSSPLGKGSILEVLLGMRGKILMLGTNFRSLTYGHYLENITPAQWANLSPWDYLGVLPVGVSVNCETTLEQLPGCSGGFVNFEKYLLSTGSISRKTFQSLEYYLIDIQTLHEHGVEFIKNFPEKFLCPPGTCKACDTRRVKLFNNGVVL